MTRRFFQVMAAALLALFQLGAHAEDIDLFTGSNTTDATAATNLLLVLDNAANFSSNAAGSTCVIDGTATALSGSVGGIEQCALYTVINSITVTATATLNLGVMVYNAANVVDKDSAACVGSTGGCLVYPLTGLTTTTKPQILAWIKSWKTTGGSALGYIKANNEAIGATIQEAWAYYYGKTGISGRSYSSIAPSTNCKNFIVFIGNSFSSSGSPGDSTGDTGPKNALEGTNSVSAKNAFPAATTGQKALITNTNTNSATYCGTVNFPASGVHENKGYYADEWSRYLRANNVTTYTVGLLGPSCQAEYAWLLSSMADYGGGKYFPTSDYTSLKAGLEAIFSEVRSVNSVFAAVSLPVSVNQQGTYLNQVFVGMFRPDAEGMPRWYGNVKQYKMGRVGGVLKLVDADGVPATSSSGSEFIAECSRSFWTPAATTTGDGYWTTYTEANCLGYPATSNSPDGNMVEKGGQAYMLRKSSPASRIVKTCSAVFTSCTSLTDFNSTNVTWTQLGLASATATNPSPAQLVNWARGQNAKTPGETASLNGTPISATDMRASAHGDIVHSRPTAINLGSDASPKVVVFYGGNDGILRAINGNQTQSFTVSSTTVSPGDEFWAFIPPEFYGKFKRLYDNTLTIANASKEYSLDGPVTSHQTSDGAWIYATMRRGGRALYAFNIDSATMGITLKWKRGCGDYTTTNCTNDVTNGDFRNIGQTWAPPQIFSAAGYSSGTASLLVMGGGYDATCEDPLSYPACASPIGNRIYVMDADTGVLKKTFTTTRGVVGDVTIINDSAGKASYMYAADLGGNVYRISGPVDSVSGAFTPMGTTVPGSWTITPIASLGCATATTTCTEPPNRKFMTAPDVIVDGSNYIVVIGSGDRERVTNTENTTSNYFFKINDRPDLGASYLADTTNCGAGATRLCLSSLLSVAKGTTPTTADLAAKKGWALVLDANEQVITSPITIYGTIYFSSHTPQENSSSVCKVNLGTLRNYAVNYSTTSGSNTPIVREDGGLSQDAVAGRVRLDGADVPFCISCTCPLCANEIPPIPTVNNPAKIRSYWYLQK